MDGVKWCIEHDALTETTTFTFQIKRYTMLVADPVDPLDSAVINTQAKTASDVALHLEILLRSIERNMERKVGCNRQELT